MGRWQLCQSETSKGLALCLPPLCTGWKIGPMILLRLHATEVSDCRWNGNVVVGTFRKMSLIHEWWVGRLGDFQRKNQASSLKVFFHMWFQMVPKGLRLLWNHLIYFHLTFVYTGTWPKHNWQHPWQTYWGLLKLYIVISLTLVKNKESFTGSDCT